MFRFSVSTLAAAALALAICSSSFTVDASPALERRAAQLMTEEEVTGAKNPTWGSDCLRGSCQQVVFNTKASGLSTQEACDRFEQTCHKRDGTTLKDSASTCSEWHGNIKASCTTHGSYVTYGVTGDVGRVAGLIQKDRQITIPAIIVPDYRKVKEDSNFPTVKDQCAGNPPDREHCDMHRFEWKRAFRQANKPKASAKEICDIWATTCEGLPALRDVVFRSQCHVINPKKGIIFASCARKEPTGVWLSETGTAAVRSQVQPVKRQHGRQCNVWKKGYCTADYPEVALFA